MSVSMGSPLCMLSVVKWNQTHPDQFWVPFPSAGLFLEWSCIGKKESGVSFLCSSSLVYLLVQASAYLKIQQFCYWSIYIVWTTWPLNPSQALSGVLHWRNGHFFAYWWAGWCASLTDRGTVCALQAPLSMEFSTQEYWSELPFPPPGDLPDSGIEHMSLTSPALATGFFTTEPPGL